MKQNKYILFIRFVAVLSILTGVSVIIGWLWDIEWLKNILPSYNYMKFNSAVCFLILGCAIFFKSQKGKTKHLISTVLSFLTLLLAAIVVSQYLFNYNCGIDQLLIKDLVASSAGNPFPGRISPVLAGSFVIIATSLLLSNRSNNRIIIHFLTYLLHFITLLSFIAIFGYIYGTPEFYRLTYPFSIAVHSAILLFLLSIAAACFNPMAGFIQLFSGNRIGNVMCRRLFPLIVSVMVILGYLRLLAHKHQLLSVELGIALFAISFIVVALLLLSNTAKHLNKLDATRMKAEEKLRELNKTLEERVMERTQAFKESEAKFYKMFHINPVGMVIAEGNTGRILEVNQSFVDMYGYSKEEAKGRTSVELGLLTAEEREHHYQTLQKQGFLKNIESRIYTKTGEPRTVVLSSEFIDIDDERFSLTIFYDISERKATEQKLAEAKKIAEESSSAKERFLANMSHEIRTPMNSIIGFTNLIEKTALNEEQHQYLTFIKNSSKNLLDLINDILDFSKIEAGMMQLEQVPFRIANIMHSVEMMFSERAKAKNIALNVHVDNSLSHMIVGDPKRLTQIMVNLLGNAVKFTKEGNINVRVNLLTKEQKNIKVRIAVQDTGIGIPANKQAQIFNRFVQASEETTRNFGGTGLGLSIVKSLVDLQHGDITLHSQEGAGSEFVIILPYIDIENEQVEEQLAVKTEMKIFSKEVKVLLAEDNVLNQILAQKVLTRFGCNVDIAENGGVAFEMVQNKKYDIVLMDNQMPVMDGYTVAQKIRRELGLTVPIIAMTAHVMPGERDRCISYGMNDYISKPFKLEVLYNLVAKYAEVS